MKRQTPFTRVEIEELRLFALGIGLAFARDRRAADGRRRYLIHEAGHIVMYTGLGITGWHVRVDGTSAETSMPRVEVPTEVSIVMALGGPLAEEWLCGPRGVFLGAVDDLWQVKRAAEVHSVAELKSFIAQTRQALSARKRYVLAAADVLGERGKLSEDDLEQIEIVAATKYGGVKPGGSTPTMPGQPPPDVHR